MEQNNQTHAYQKLMEQAPQIRASGLEGDYRTLAEFDNVVLAGHQTRFGLEFVTWEWVQNHTSLWQGHYHGDDYDAARQDFVTRSGLLPQERIFSDRQLRELYRCVKFTEENALVITGESEKLMEAIADQIEQLLPDVAEEAEMKQSPGQGMEMNM